MARPCSRPCASAFLCWLLIGRRPFRAFAVERFEFDLGVICALVISFIRLQNASRLLEWSLPRILQIATSAQPPSNASEAAGKLLASCHGPSVEMILIELCK